MPVFSQATAKPFVPFERRPLYRRLVGVAWARHTDYSSKVTLIDVSGYSGMLYLMGIDVSSTYAQCHLYITVDGELLLASDGNSYYSVSQAKGTNFIFPDYDLLTDYSNVSYLKSGPIYFNESLEVKVRPLTNSSASYDVRVNYGCEVYLND